MISDVFEDEVRKFNYKPSKPGILLKQRQNVVGMFVTLKCRFIPAKLGILFKQRQNVLRIFLAPKWRFIEAVWLVIRWICGSHGHPPI